MNRRAFFRIIAALPVLGPAAVLAARARNLPRTPVLLQVSPVAGFQYHDGPVVWDCVRPDDELQLVREPRNPHDDKAVAVYWKRWKVGYLPRRENAVVAQMLDRQVSLRAKVETLRESRNPWERVSFSVSLT